MAEMFIKVVVGTILFCFIGVTVLTMILWAIDKVKEWFK